jgi:hypothetical protein
MACDFKFQFLSLFILEGTPKIKLGMPATDLVALKVSDSDDKRMVRFKGELSSKYLG